MNVLVEELVRKLSRNDTALKRLSLNRLPLWTVTADEIRVLIQALTYNTHVAHLEFWLPVMADDDGSSEGSEAYDFSAVAENTSSCELKPPTSHPIIEDFSYLETTLEKNNTLRSLQIGCSSKNNRAWTSLFRGLTKNKNVQELELDGGCTGFKLDTIFCQLLADYIASSNTLHELVLSGISTDSAEGMLALARGMARNTCIECLEITKLKARNNGNVGDQEWNEALALFLQSLSQIPTLKTLRLIECDLSWEDTTSSLAIETLCQSTSLECLRWIDSDLSVSAVSSLSIGLRNNKSVRVLDFRGNGLSQLHCIPLGELLMNADSSVQELILEENLIGDDGITSLLHGLVKLRKVNLRCNLISTQGCKALATVLANAKAPLQILDLSENAIEDEGAKMLTPLIALGNLLELDIETCLLTDKGVADIAQGLCDNDCSLQSLSLGQNHFTDLGAQALHDMLKKNKSLLSLDLTSCYLSDQSIIILAQGLKRTCNRTLKRLFLPFNKFGNEGARALAHVLPESHLEQLECQFNDFLKVDGLNAIVLGLSNNVWMTDLYPRTIQASYWLSLNRAGRRAVFDDHFPLSLWPRLLERADKVTGPDAVFYMLRNRPGLVY